MTNLKLSLSQVKFNSLAAYLRQHGYTVQVTNGQEISVANITEQGIIGGFAVSHWGDSITDMNISRHILNHITFEKAEWFDKFSTCTYSMPIPDSDYDRQVILDRMKQLRDRAINDFD